MLLNTPVYKVGHGFAKNMLQCHSGCTDFVRIWYTMLKYDYVGLRIKGTLVGNFKNEIIKFYDEVDIKVLFPLISERNLFFLQNKKAFIQQKTGM